MKAAAALLGVAAVLCAGCGSGGGSTHAASTTTPAQTETKSPTATTPSPSGTTSSTSPTATTGVPSQMQSPSVPLQPGRKVLKTKKSFVSTATAACEEVAAGFPPASALPSNARQRLVVRARLGRLAAVKRQAALVQLQPPPDQRQRFQALMKANLDLVAFYDSLARVGKPKKSTVAKKTRALNSHERHVRTVARKAGVAACGPRSLA